MHDEGQGVHHLAVEHHVQLHQVRLLVSHHLIVKGSVAAGAGLEGVKKVVHDFVERELIVDVHPARVDVLHVLKYAPPLLAQVHDVAHELGGRENMGVGNRLLRLGMVPGSG